jgi:hypothetical protein
MSRDRDNGPGDGPKLRLVRDVDDASREHAVDDEALAAELGDELPGSQLADDEVHERIVRRVVTSPGAGRPAAGRPSRSVWLGALAALAAGVALFFGAMSAEQGAGPTSRTAPNGNAPNNGIEQPAPPSVAATLIQARSTQELFDPATPFAKKGGESKRLDVIARARAADLRANRFAAWGVR